jgi:hypothetical protein
MVPLRSFCQCCGAVNISFGSGSAELTLHAYLSLYNYHWLIVGAGMIVGSNLHRAVRPSGGERIGGKQPIWSLRSKQRRQKNYKNYIMQN